MANPFDQFDSATPSKSTAPSASSNPFDQFNESVSSAPPEQTGPGRYLRMGRNTIVSGLTQGLGIPGDVQATLRPYLAPYLPESLNQQNLPTTSDIQGAIAPLGLVPSQVGVTSGGGPYPNLERYGTAALAGAASMLPALAFGGGAPAFLKTATQGAAGGIAGEAARQLAPDIPGAPTAAGLITGGLLQGGLNLISGDTFKNAARSLGSSSTLQEAGTGFQDAIDSWRDRSGPSGMNMMDQKIAQAEAPLVAGIPPNASTPLQDLMANIQDKFQLGGQAANSIKSFLRDTEKSGGFIGSVVGKINQAISQAALGGQMVAPDVGWEGGRQLRSELGASFRTAKPQDRGALEYMYKGLTNDLGWTAINHGLGDEFQNFNQVSTSLHQLDAGPVEKIANAAPGDAAQTLLTQAKRDGSTLQALRDNGFGPQVDDLAAAHLSMNPAGWKNLSREGRAALVSDPSLRASLDAASAAGKPNLLTRGVGHLSGLGLGEAVGAVAGHMLGYPELFAGPVGGLIGYGASYLPGLTHTMTQPNMLGAETAGAIGATAYPPPLGMTYQLSPSRP